MSERGTVYWFTGLSGAGKSTLSRLFVDRLRRSGRASVLLDGDMLRDLFDDGRGHGRDDRLKIAMRNSRLCKLLAEQGVDVVCATISMFHACQDWNRTNISEYREIFVRAPREILERRDAKGIYRGAAAGAVANVVGVDIAAEEPRHPDLIVDNDGSRSPEDEVTRIWSLLRMP